eukprot:TRINITY_DN1568_c0_g1_i1.p2 TRINITY_DN1568_c0_g1~~TRINITY_DN1568_c0_g1_i1.p2  ORF type:complete len:136 (+),score=18.48 TRINITY_DN1568_c0_g1_i1:23-409(+)
MGDAQPLDDDFDEDLDLQDDMESAVGDEELILNDTESHVPPEAIDAWDDGDGGEEEEEDRAPGDPEEETADTVMADGSPGMDDAWAGRGLGTRDDWTGSRSSGVSSWSVTGHFPCCCRYFSTMRFSKR